MHAQSDVHSKEREREKYACKGALSDPARRFAHVIVRHMIVRHTSINEIRRFI